MSPRDRVIVELRFRDELLQREIAELLGISQVQVSRILTRSIATLRELAETPELAAAASTVCKRPHRRSADAPWQERGARAGKLVPWPSCSPSCRMTIADSASG